MDYIYCLAGWSNYGHLREFLYLREVKILNPEFETPNKLKIRILNVQNGFEFT